MITEAFVILGYKAFDAYYSNTSISRKIGSFLYPNTGLSKKIKPYPPAGLPSQWPKITFPKTVLRPKA